MTMRTTVRLPADLLKRAKRKAAAEGRTMTSLIADGLRLILVEKKQDQTARQVILPVSTATGGLMPGVDISSSAGLQELEDLEYVERMKRRK
jgi:hypothetical protein